MANFDSPRRAAGALAFGAPLFALVDAVTTWRDARATRQVLSGLSDHELDDIGLVRGDIDALSRR